MLLVKTYLNKSNLHGIGLFAGENIKAGTVVYKPTPELDVSLTEEEFLKLEPPCKEALQHYGFKNKTDGKWHLAFDDIRFCNHSTNGNLTQTKADGSCLIAKRDIAKGEELSQNYQEFETLRRELL